VVFSIFAEAVPLRICTFTFNTFQWS